MEFSVQASLSYNTICMLQLTYSKVYMFFIRLTYCCYNDNIYISKEYHRKMDKVFSSKKIWLV